MGNTDMAQPSTPLDTLSTTGTTPPSTTPPHSTMVPPSTTPHTMAPHSTTHPFTMPHTMAPHSTTPPSTMPLSSTTPQSQLPLINPLPSQFPPPLTLPHPLPMLSLPKSPPNLMPSNTVLLMNTLDLNSVPQKPLTAKLSLDHTLLLFPMVASKP